RALLIGGVLRAALFLLLVPPWTALSFVLASLGLLVDPMRGRAAVVASRLWGHGLLLLSGARLRVEGAERWSREPCVVMANHASYLDIPALLAAFPRPMRIVARRSLVWLPFIGWYVALAGNFFVDREDARQAVRLFE